MKKIVLLILVVCIPFFILAQIEIKLNGTVTKNISSNITKGQSVILRNINEIDGVNEAVVYWDTINYSSERVPLNMLDRISFEFTNSIEFWKLQALKYGVYDNISRNGFQYKLRKDIEEEVIDYISYIERNNMTFNDSYLESYVYALAYKIYPIKLGDGRPGILNIKIIKDPIPQAYIFANGTMVLTTGLLSTINSEDELIGVMAHEIAHFVLDHSVININKAEIRRKRAEFWAGIATTVAVAADLYTSTNNDYYVPGTIAMNTAIMAYSIASEVSERMGLKFSREQELEADKCASALMKFLNMDPTALSSSLLKIKKYSILNGNYYVLSDEGTHPSINSRVSQIGYPMKEFYNPEYDITISFVNSYNAIVQLNQHHLQSSSNLVNRNIEVGVATEDDYVLLAMITTFMYDNKEKNNEALEYITLAKSLNISPTINIHKQEAIILIRLDEYEKAKGSLIKYLDSIEIAQSKLIYYNNSREWSYDKDYLNNEKEWTLKMINKVDNM
jgi:beta-barrel assembly-enhancing protease